MDWMALQRNRKAHYSVAGDSVFYLWEDKTSREDGKRMYDVIVVEAGPAGCTAAKALAEKEYKVPLVEKFKMPRYKSCSGVLIKKSMELVKNYFGEDVPEAAIVPRQRTGARFSRMTGGKNTVSSRRALMYGAAFLTGRLPGF